MSPQPRKDDAQKGIVFFLVPDGTWKRKPANKCQAPKCGVQEKFRNIKKDMEKTPEMISPVKRQILNV